MCSFRRDIVLMCLTFGLFLSYAKPSHACSELGSCVEQPTHLHLDTSPLLGSEILMPNNLQEEAKIAALFSLTN